MINTKKRIQKVNHKIKDLDGQIKRISLQRNLGIEIKSIKEKGIKISIDVDGENLIIEINYKIKNFKILKI